ncbi:universal stress protein [Vampirovibrio sp.]|uniref:universal stress protein n=1 Tax=Vampirovibrio sp. TaxID=2717857 RepID=UPI00359487DF
MKILLPIDGSDCANHTLSWVADTFDRQNTQYYLLFVIPVLPDLNTVEFDIVEANAMLRKARNLLEGKGCMVVSTDYALGDIVEQICSYADEIEADQIVIGSHGRTGFSKLLMGSTSIRVLEHSHRPVTLHRNIERPVRERGLSSGTVF